MIDPETFGSLLRDGAHWKFELFVGGIEMLVFDGLIGWLAFPFIRKHWQHHIARDRRESGGNIGGFVPMSYKMQITSPSGENSKCQFHQTGEGK